MNSNILKFTVVVLIVATSTIFSPLTADAYVSVKGYYRSDGTYVKPHVRSNPNGLKYDNYGWKPSQGLYNDSYGTRDTYWDTPTYITDPDYYTGKSLYESNQPGNNYDTYSNYNFGNFYLDQQPNCPLNSTYNSLSGDCKCNYGYVVDTGTFGGESCILGSSYCTQEYGYGSNFNSVDKTCECNYGYVFNSHGTKCISVDDSCKNTYGYNAKSNLAGDKCECKYGYRFNESVTKCISNDDYCQNLYGYYSEATVLGDTCGCKSEYLFDSTSQKCIGASDYCSDRYGYHSEYDSWLKECVCRDGYIFKNDYCVEEEEENDIVIDLINYDNTITESVIELQNPQIKIEEVVKDTNVLKERPAAKPFNKPTTLNCEDGYAPSLNKKFCVMIPEHAHAVESTTDVWLCDENYKEVGNTCEWIRPKAKPRERVTKIEEPESFIEILFRKLKFW